MNIIVRILPFQKNSIVLKEGVNFNKPRYVKLFV